MSPGLPHRSVANVLLNYLSVLAYDDEVSGFTLSSPYKAIVFPPEERDEATAIHSPTHTGFPISGLTVPVSARPSGSMAGNSGDQPPFRGNEDVTPVPQSSGANDGGIPQFHRSRGRFQGG